MRWLLRILLGLVSLVIVVVVTCYAIGSVRFNEKFAIAEPALTIPTDKASIARGRHLAFAITKCAGCHGKDLSGTVLIDAPPFRVVPPNLTRGSGGVGSTFTDADFARAIRDGVGPDGRGFILMPSERYASLSDADLADIIAYVKSVAPVDHQLPGTNLKPLGRIMVGFSSLKRALMGAPPRPIFDAAAIDHSTRHVATMPQAMSVEYGHYVAVTGLCMDCHGAELSGGHFAGGSNDPPAQNITPSGIGTWGDADIVRALRVGKRPDGTTIDPFMPWAYTAQMSDVEMKALIMYLRSVPPRPTGK